MKTNVLQQKDTGGFTLIEMIVSLGVFSVVITIAVGALLSLIASNQRLQGEQSVMTNLAFALDSMTREIRTGFNYYCADRPNYTAGSADAIFTFAPGNTAHEDLNNAQKNCPNGRGSTRLQGVSFFEGGNSLTGSSSTRVLYFYDADAKAIYRRVGDGPAQTITSPSIIIEHAEFYVTGTSPIGNSNSIDGQPTVTIFIQAREATAATTDLFYLQTSVTQRTLDI